MITYSSIKDIVDSLEEGAVTFWDREEEKVIFPTNMDEAHKLTVDDRFMSLTGYYSWKNAPLVRLMDISDIDVFTNYLTIFPQYNWVDKNESIKEFPNKSRRVNAILAYFAIIMAIDYHLKIPDWVAREDCISDEEVSRCFNYEPDPLAGYFNLKLDKRYFGRV